MRNMHVVMETSMSSLPKNIVNIIHYNGSYLIIYGYSLAKQFAVNVNTDNDHRALVELALTGRPNVHTSL